MTTPIIRKNWLFIGSAKELFPGRKCVIIFQPHLFSRTRDFADAFAASLDMADEVILLPLYPARELPMEGSQQPTILEQNDKGKKQILTKTGIGTGWKNSRGKEKLLLITAGAGDIDEAG